VRGVGGEVECSAYHTLHEACGAGVLALVPSDSTSCASDILQAGADDCQVTSISQPEVAAMFRVILRNAVSVGVPARPVAAPG
jgi:hypothetical protein